MDYQYRSINELDYVDIDRDEALCILGETYIDPDRALAHLEATKMPIIANFNDYSVVRLRPIHETALPQTHKVKVADNEELLFA